MFGLIPVTQPKLAFRRADGAQAACQLAGGCAIWAGANDLDGVGDLEKAVPLACPGGPAFDFWSFDFDGSTAVPTDEVVMVVTGGAATVASFAVIAS